MVTADHDHHTGRSDGNGDPPTATVPVGHLQPQRAAAIRRAPPLDPAGAPPRRSIATTRAIPDRTSSAAANSRMTRSPRAGATNRSLRSRSGPAGLDAGTVSGTVVIDRPPAAR